MNLILNKNFELPADGWFQIIPRGTFPWRPDPDAAAIDQLVDEEACNSILNRFKEDTAKINFGGILVDYDHFSLDTDKSSEAAGWIMDLQNRADGIYAQIRWAGDGEAKVKSGAYRYVSPVWNRGDCQKVGAALRPLRLSCVALTNDPNMKGIKPLSNRSQEPAPADTGKATPDGSGNEESSMDYKAQLLSLLGLPATATDDDITTGCSQSKESAKNRATEVELLTNRATSAESKLAGIEKTALEAQVEKDLNEHAGVIVNRAEWKTRLMADREGTLKLLQGVVKPGQKVLNRAAGTPEARQQDDADKDSEQARKIRNRAMDIQAKNPRKQFSACWAEAEKELKPAQQS